MNDTDFAREVKERSIGGVYFFYGDEDYLKNYRAAEAVKIISEEDETLAAFNVFELSYGEGEIDLTEIENALSSPPMMSPQKITLISHSSLDSLKEKEKSALTALLESYSNSPDSTVILKASSGGFDDGTDKKPSPFLKSMQKFAKTVKFDYQSPQKLHSWLTRHAQKYGVGITPEASELLIYKSGRSMYSLSGEISKIAAYTASHHLPLITNTEVELCASPSDEDDAFKLANAITDGDTEEAFRQLGVKIRLRTDPFYLLAQIAKTFADLAAAACYIEDGREKSDFAKEMKIHEYKAGILYRAAKNAPPDYFAYTAELCLKAERNMKTMSKTSQNSYGEIERLIGLAARSEYVPPENPDESTEKKHE